MVSVNLDYVDESENLKVNILPGTVILAGDPAPDLDIKKARELIYQISSEQELADLYADVSNKAFWIEDEEYDYEEGSEEHIKACQITDEWFDEEGRLREMIFYLLRSEGIETPEYGYMPVLSIFMERNGYRDGNGWWVKKE